MKMNKIVASVSAAALAVSALATSALAAGPYTYDAKGKAVDNYTVTLYGESAEADFVDVTSLVTSPVKFKLANAMGSDKLNELTFNGGITVKQDYKGTLDSTTKSDEGTVGGTAEVKDVAIAETEDKEFEVKVNAVSNLLQGLTTGVTWDTTKKTKYTATLTVTLSKDQMKTLTGDAFDGTGLFKANGYAVDAAKLQKQVTKQLIQTVASKITVTPSEANGVIATSNTITTWKISALTINEKDTYDDIKGNRIPYEMIGKFNQLALKDLAKGGKMTVNLKDELPSNSQYVVRATFENDQLRQSTSAEAVFEGKSVTFTLPANFTYSPAADIYGEPTIWLEALAGHDWTKVDKAEVDTIVLEPAAADVAAETTAPTANEGDDQTNKPAETQKPAAEGDKNQPTGVAIAIVPAIVAAAGVIISKKRK